MTLDTEADHIKAGGIRLWSSWSYLQQVPWYVVSHELIKDTEIRPKHFNLLSSK